MFWSPNEVIQRAYFGTKFKGEQEAQEWVTHKMAFWELLFFFTIFLFNLVKWQNF